MTPIQKCGVCGMGVPDPTFPTWHVCPSLIIQATPTAPVIVFQPSVSVSATAVTVARATVLP